MGKINPRVTVWIDRPSRRERIVSTIAGILILGVLLLVPTAIAIALWQVGAIGGFVLGFSVCRILKA